VPEIRQSVEGSRNLVAGRDVINNFVLPPAADADHTNLRLLADRVHSFWVRGVLEHSIHGAVLVDLRRDERPDAIVHPWASVISEASDIPKSSSPDDSVDAAFERYGRSLLILGEPGAGKTTTLLCLARTLLSDLDSGNSGPVPVVLSLSTWKEHRGTLASWIVREIRDRYSIPPALSKRWLSEGRLLPLLDGLDETAPEFRESCVTAINGYVALTGLVVTSRVAEYEALSGRLRVNAATQLLPMTTEQILRFVEQVGAPLAALHRAIIDGTEWQALASSPLMLSVMALAFRDDDGSAFRDGDNDIARRRRVFSLYVDRMIQRRGAAWQPELRQSLRPVLAHLAVKMKAHGATMFATDQLQPSWLSTQTLIKRYLQTSRILVTIFCSAVFIPWRLLPRSFYGAQANVPFRADLTFLLLPLVIGGTAASLTLAQWTGPSARFRRAILGILIALFGAATGGIPIVWRAFSRSQTNDINLLLVTQWSAKVMLSRLRRWSWNCIRYVGPLAILGSVICFVLFRSERGGPNAIEAAMVAPIVLLLALLYVTIPALLFGGFTRNSVERQDATDGMRRALKSSLVWLVATAIVSMGLVAWSLGKRVSVISSLALSVEFVGVNLVLVNGGFDVIAHLVLRYMLARHEAIPRNLRLYLNAGAAAVLLQSVGGSYRFVHVLLRDVLADEASLSR
jgi:DNA polymerase III delta prime subunit